MLYESKGFSSKQLKEAAEENTFHPAVTEALRWFVDDGHLPWNLAAVNNSFGELALNLAVAAPRQTQTTHCLNHLLAAKDSAVRAFVAEEEDEDVKDTAETRDFIGDRPIEDVALSEGDEWSLWAPSGEENGDTDVSGD
jgi:hypothetical protein